MGRAAQVKEIANDSVSLDDIECPILKMGPRREKPWLRPWKTHKMSLHQDTKVRSNGWQASCVTNPLLLHPAVFNTLGSFSHSLKCGFAYWLPNPQESLSSPGPLWFSKLEKNKKNKKVCVANPIITGSDFHLNFSSPTGLQGSLVDGRHQGFKVCVQ